MDIKQVVPTRRAWSLLEEFKAFAFKGNVVDLAIGVIIGAAFGKIVDSLVKNIIMPLISVVLPAQQRYQDWALVINGKTIPYGQFLAEVINFLIVAAALFLFVVKFLGWLMKSREEGAEAPPPPAPPTPDQILLAEIRDLLKAQTAANGQPGDQPPPSA